MKMERLEDCLTFLLGKAHQRVYQYGKEALKPYGITPVQFAFLHVLWERDGQVGADIGERLRLDSATMTGLIDRLVQNHCVERRPDARDRRVNRIYLTERGRGLQDVLPDSMERANEELLAGFSEQDQAVLRRLLGRLGLVATREMEEEQL